MPRRFAAKVIQLQGHGRRRYLHLPGSLWEIQLQGHGDKALDLISLGSLKETQLQGHGGKASLSLSLSLQGLNHPPPPPLKKRTEFNMTAERSTFCKKKCFFQLSC